MVRAGDVTCARDIKILLQIKATENGNPAKAHCRIQQRRAARGATVRNSLRRSLRHIRHPVRMPLDERRMDRTEQPNNPGDGSWVAAAAMTVNSSPGTSPNLFSNTAPENSPTFGSPVRLNATAPMLAGSRDIPSAPPDRGAFARAFLRRTWRATVFGADEGESALPSACTPLVLDAFNDDWRIQYTCTSSCEDRAHTPFEARSDRSQPSG